MTTKRPVNCIKHMETLLSGVDIICKKADTYKNIRFGFVTNNAATTIEGKLSRTALLKAGFNLIKLFSPEHGLTAQGADGTYQPNQTDPVTLLPVISLYGEHLAPSATDLEGIDMMLFDIPDVGCRFYTYLWTMTYIMEACARHQVPLLLLDRPNPLSGNIEKTEGPLLDEINCSSFTGRWNIPIRHSCTLGELASYFAATRVTNLNLKIIEIKNWNVTETIPEPGYNFVPTSPAIKDLETAFLYPGTGLVEGINVNEGRGTDTAFKIIGAPWIDAMELMNAFHKLRLPGISADTTDYIPYSGLYSGEKCYGLKFSLTDKDKFRPVEMGLQLLRLIISLFPESCRERLYTTLANPAGKCHLDQLTGIKHAFEFIKKGSLPVTTLAKKDWEEFISPYLIYRRMNQKSVR
jgi:uncharacterized protein YbbC (DUF1343 family)